MKWNRFSWDDKTTWPPENIGVLFKRSYSNLPYYIMTVGHISLDPPRDFRTQIYFDGGHARFMIHEGDITHWCLIEAPPTVED